MKHTRYLPRRLIPKYIKPVIYSGFFRTTRLWTIGAKRFFRDSFRNGSKIRFNTKKTPLNCCPVYFNDIYTHHGEAFVIWCQFNSHIESRVQILTQWPVSREPAHIPYHKCKGLMPWQVFWLHSTNVSFLSTDYLFRNTEQISNV